mgnify:CR=1 FL=1
MTPKENIELIELAIWNSKRLKNTADEISYLELLLTIKNNPDTYGKLAEVYRKEKMYNDQIRVLKEWLKIDPENNKPNEELKLAFKKTGRDEFEIDKADVWPVPFEGEVNVSTKHEMASISLIDMFGKEIKRVSVNGLMKYRIEDLENLPPGSYVLRVTYENGMKSNHKIVHLR